MTLYKRNLNILQDYKTVYKRKFKDEINNLIKFYEDRKVFNVRTVKTVLDKLTDKDNKKRVTLGIQEYNKLFEKYKDADPFPLKRKKTKAVLKIQNLLRNSVIFEIVKQESALDNNVIEITIQPQRIGTIAAMDIKTILYKAYIKVIKMLPKKSAFKFYSSVNFTTNDRERNSLVSNEYTSEKPGPWASHVEAQIEKAVQSDERIQLKNLLIKFHFIMVPAGGRGSATQSRDKESILNKKSVLRIKNDDNNCFWYALSALVHKNIKNIRDSRNTVARERYAKELCNKCKQPWGRAVDFLQLPLIEEALDCNIFIMDIDNIPILNSKINVWHALMYKTENKNKEQFWLLHGDRHYNESSNDAKGGRQSPSQQSCGHYDAITNIKGFLAVDYFCNKCLQCFKHKELFDNHECGETKKKRRLNKKSVTDKDLAHYLKGTFCKGSREELEEKIKKEREHMAKFRDGFYNEELKIKCLIEEHDTEQYIVYDFETDTHTLTHRPNHVEIDILKIEPKLKAGLPSHDYKDCLVKTEKFEGYGCDDKFCEWLFKRGSHNTTVFAHNGGGYDNKFVLQWCLSKGMLPSSYIRSGSHIMYMAFKKFKIRFVDTYYFFLEPLKALSNTYNIDTLKGYFPHHFNKPENQDYIGTIPSEDMFGASNMTPKEYKESFSPWYETVKDKTDWNFKEELKRYCRADVELLSKAILKYRKMFKETLDVDPFRYVTLPSLCMSIYINKFLPDKTIVGNSADKIVSTVCKEWLIHLNDANLTPETPIVVEKNENIDYNKDRINKEKAHYKDKCLFTVDAFDSKNKIVKEFYGCYWHGCPKCFPENAEKYDKTVERRNILEGAGYRVDEMWECEWCEIKKGLPEREAIEQLAKDQSIVIRDALFGGRTEAFKSYVKCEKHQKIFYYDVVSLYPTVNSLDEYAVGFKKYLNLYKYGINPKSQIDGFIKDLLSGKFCGVAKVDVTPPKDLYIPLLPDNSNGKLLFHLNPLIGKTYSSIELKRALEKGYKIDKLYSALEYKKYTGLMKAYVGNFLKMKIENSGIKTQEECDDINKSHKELGFDFEIKPEDTRPKNGLRQLAKICLNSLWGKFGQRSTLGNYNFYYDYKKLIAKMHDNTIKGMKWHIVNNNCVELRYEEDNDISIEADYISEITAVFTTSNARMRLYDMLDWLHPSQVLYCDTDSVMILYDETNPNHKYPKNDKSNPKTIKFGDGLGEWEDEFKEDKSKGIKKGWITELVIGGAKSYAYITNEGKIVIRQKGITLDRANSNKVTFDAMRDMVLKNKPIKTEKRYQFRWDNNTKDIVTIFIDRSIKATIGEKRTPVKYDSLPFGYEIN